MKIRYNLIVGQSTFKGEIEADENDVKYDHDERTDIYSLTIKDICIYKTMSKREFKIVNTAIHNLLSGEYTPEDISLLGLGFIEEVKPTSKNLADGTFFANSRPRNLAPIKELNEESPLLGNKK
ncbi:MAG: hypothetical protein KA318_00090 [Nitrosomonas sp.]|nr:hypothetical protein [Nitrosomonas sp.]